jgi:DNA-binding CsgD family transcriptional regulator
MVLTRTDENELLTALYGGVLDTQPWGLFLRRFRARTAGDLCRIHIRASGEPGAEWREVNSDSDRRASVTGVPGDVLPSFSDMRPGRVYDSAELGLGTEGFARFMRVTVPDGAEAALSMIRAGEDFRAREAALLSGLAPHLAIAVRSLTELDRQRQHNAMAQHLLDADAFGWLLIDARGRVLDCDKGALAMLEDGATIRRASDGHLRFLYPDSENLLDQLLQGPETALGVLRAAWADDDPPIQALFLPPPTGVSERLPAPAHLIVLRSVLRDEMPVEGLLIDLFSLTRSEAALALRIANGESIAEAAESLGLTVETARNYSKRIYTKMGAHGQADVVRIVLNGVTALAAQPL